MHEPTVGEPVTGELLELIENKVQEQKASSLAESPLVQKTLALYETVNSLKEQLHPLSKQSCRYQTLKRKLTKVENAIAKLSKPKRNLRRR